MPAPAGYVGYTVVQEAVVQTCVRAYQPATPRPPSIQNVYARAAEWVQQSQPGAVLPPGVPLPPPSFRNGFSFFEFIVEINNLNGARPVPAGHVIVARITTQSSRIDPCGAPPRTRNSTYYEKFGQPAIDIQSAVTSCDSEYCFQRTAEYAILPDPAAATAIPAGEHAVVINLNAPQTQSFAQAVTLRLWWHWEYDHCNQPGQNRLFFSAETRDPTQGGAVTWTLPGSPLEYPKP